MTREGREYYDGGLETIEKQERFIELLVERGVPIRRAFDLATGAKYIDRAGDKPGESIEHDLGKAADYTVKGLCGQWEIER